MLADNRVPAKLLGPHSLTFSLRCAISWPVHGRSLHHADLALVRPIRRVPCQRRPLRRARHRRRQGPGRRERRPPRPVRADLLPAAGRGSGRVPPRTRRLWLAVWAPRDLHEHEAAGAAIRAMWREIRADRLEAAGADRPVRRRRDRRRGRAAGGQGRGRSRPWPRSCATAAGSSASTGGEDHWRPCAARASRPAQPRPATTHRGCRASPPKPNSRSCIAASARRTEPCLGWLWQKGVAPTPCRGWVRGVGDRYEPRV